SASVTANATTQTVVTIPAAPSSLTAASISSSQINLSWVDNSNNESQFVIDIATDSGFTQVTGIASVTSNITSYSATGLSSATTYYFRVHATNSAGSSTN